MLAGLHLRREHDSLTVIGLLDVSGSVRRFAQPPVSDETDMTETRSYLEYLRQWFRRATQTKAPDDRFGLVVFDGEAVALAAPTTGPYAVDDLDVRTVPGTSIADAIRLGLAMFPADTARRLVLVSDGNETIGDAIEAARQAAGASAGADALTRGRAVPIDVLPIAYRVSGDVQIARLEAPPGAQPGQTITVRIVMEATRETTGRLSLRCENQAVDLNGAEPGRSRNIVVPEGQSVQLAEVELAETPVNRFEAVFEPDDPAADVLPDNNRAESFTATPGKGKILILDSRVQERPSLPAAILREAGLPVSVEAPESLPGDLLSLQNYDLIILDNVPAHELPPAAHALLARYVNDLGGGLIMLGGENSFGAGGWNGTALEAVLPLELDPPREMRLPQAALVLVLDRSGSMNMHVAGARATQQEVANEAAALAIESLRAESLVGVVTFNEFASEYVPLQRNDDPAAIARKVRGITAGGGTNIGPALRKAHTMLENVEAERKRVVCLSDGQSPTGGLDAIVQGMVADNIKLTTIAVGDRADQNTMMRLAELGKGEFYPVINPKALPQVLVDSVQIINKPLIKEVPFVPVVRPTGASLTIGMENAPELEGLVVTAPRDDPRAVIELTDPDGEPLLARWQAGLGRVAAFTSDLGGPWSQNWVNWPVAARFFTQLARTTARPAVSHDAELITTIRDGRLQIILEAADPEEGFLDYLQVEGTVYAPHGDPIAVRLPQTAPGRYETSIPARDTGNYIVALNPRRGSRQLAPVIGGASRTTGEEFRRYRSNLALLDRIVELTAGRRLSLTEPGAVDLFDRSGMPPSVSLLPAWRDVLWAGLVLLLLDIAARRIAWSVGGVRRLAARALARVSPASVRGGEAAATLASLKRVSAEFDDRLETSARRVEKLQPPPPVEPPTRYESPGDAPSPEPSRIAAALSALLGRGRPKERARPTEEPAERPEEERTGSTDTTRGLLEAKRRTRKQLGDDR
jgi:Ca-activated chloride channel family protein